MAEHIDRNAVATLAEGLAEYLDRRGVDAHCAVALQIGARHLLQDAERSGQTLQQGRGGIPLHL